MRLAPVAAGFEIEAADLAALLGRDPDEVRRMLRKGDITTRIERGEGEDAGRARVTFYDGARCVRLIVDAGGEVLKRTRTPMPRSPARPAAPR